MSYENQLTEEIYAILERLAAEQQPWRAQWIAHEICQSHKDGLAEGDARLFWEHCGYEKICDLVRRCINRRAGDRELPDEAQLRLPGYERLQAYYMVKRNGDDIGVSVHDLTDAELIEKAALYRSMAAAAYAHADEIDRFRRLKSADATPLFAAPSPASDERPAA